jgi:SAM domain (Sterile alpha motif)
MDTCAWLRGLGLERYEQAFRENAIDEAILPKLTAEDLRELGVTAVGHRRILLDAIAALRAEPIGETKALVLDHVPVVVRLAVLLSLGASQKHDATNLCETNQAWESGRSSLQPFLTEIEDPARGKSNT